MHVLVFSTYINDVLYEAEMDCCFYVNIDLVDIKLNTFVCMAVTFDVPYTQAGTDQSCITLYVKCIFRILFSGN